MDKTTDERNRSIGETVTRLVPFFVAVLVAIGFSGTSAFQPSPLFTTVLVGVLGFQLGQWFDLGNILRKVTRVVDRLDDGEFKIRQLNGPSLAEAMKSMYHSPRAKIYATHIDYRTDDLTKVDARSEDWGAHLYNGANAQVNTVFRRIVSVSSRGDREWVRKTLLMSKNSEYRVGILEGEPNQLPYPNLIIVEEEGGALRALVSFRGATATGSGRFAFTTSSPDFVAGLRDHFMSFFDDLPSAKVCVEKWEASGALQPMANPNVPPVRSGSLPTETPPPGDG